MSDTNPLGQLTSSSDWSSGKRVRENLSITAKGQAQIEVTIEYLNQETSRLAKNPKDVADVDTVTLEDEMVKRLEILTKKLNDVGITCTHQVKPAH